MNVAGVASAKLERDAYSVGEDLRVQAKEDGEKIVKYSLSFQRNFSNPRFDAAMGVVILVTVAVAGL